jgi:PHP domain
MLTVTQPHDSAQDAPENPFEQEGLWLRANLHTHTTCSDGRWSPEETAQQYRQKGYDVLVITDHSTVTPVDGLSDDQMLVVRGQEMHPTGRNGVLYHMLAVGMQESIEGKAYSVQECIDAARGQGALVFKAHPVWCGLTSADVNELEGISGIEVWNATCLRHAKPSSEALWEELLHCGRFLPALAVDDCHRPDEHYRGDFATAWIMVKAAEKSAEAFMAAVAAGRYYATLGPVIEDFRLEADAASASGWRATARFSGARAVWFVSDTSSGRCYEFPDEAEAVTEWEHPLSDRARYVRLVVEDRAGLRAWSGPLVVPEQLGAGQSGR